MAQIRINEYQSQDNSLLSNEEKLAHLPSGMYYGFDVGAFGANMTLSFNHNATGITRYSADSNTPSGPWGTIVTRQGTVIFDSDPRTFAIAPTTVASRTDAIICTHTYTLVTNGVVASYAVQQGYNGDESTLPANAVLIGTLFLPANTSALNAVGVVYTDKRIKNIKTLATEIEGLQTQIDSLSFNKYDKVQGDATIILDTALNTVGNYYDGWNYKGDLNSDKVRVLKTQDGRLCFKGIAKVTNNSIGDSSIFQLPAGFVVSSLSQIPVLIKRGSVYLNEVLFIGNVATVPTVYLSPTYTKTLNDLVYFDGISFYNDNPS